MKPMVNAKPFILVIVIVPFLGTVLAIVLLWQQAVHWSDLITPYPRSAALTSYRH